METSNGPTVRRVGRSQAQEPVQEPAPAHVLSSGDNSDYDREATELQDAIFRHRVYLGPQEALPRGPPWWEAIKKFWRNNVVLSTSHVECRDHFGKLFTPERGRRSRAISRQKVTIRGGWSAIKDPRRHNIKRCSDRCLHSEPLWWPGSSVTFRTTEKANERASTSERAHLSRLSAHLARAFNDRDRCGATLSSPALAQPGRQLWLLRAQRAAVDSVPGERHPGPATGMCALLSTADSDVAR